MRFTGDFGVKGVPDKGGSWDASFYARQTSSILASSWFYLRCTVPGLADVQANETYVADLMVQGTIDDGVKKGMKTWTGKVYLNGGSTTGSVVIIGTSLTMDGSVGSDVADLPGDSNYNLRFNGRTFELGFQVNVALDANWVARMTGIRTTGTQIGS